MSRGQRAGGSATAVATRRRRPRTGTRVDRRDGGGGRRDAMSPRGRPDWTRARGAGTASGTAVLKVWARADGVRVARRSAGRPWRGRQHYRGPTAVPRRGGGARLPQETSTGATKCIQCNRHAQGTRQKESRLSRKKRRGGRDVAGAKERGRHPGWWWWRRRPAVARRHGAKERGDGGRCARRGVALIIIVALPANPHRGRRVGQHHPHRACTRGTARARPSVDDTKEQATQRRGGDDDGT